MAEKIKKQIEPYLKILYSIFKIEKVGFGAKILWAYFEGFGAQGCWQTDDEIAAVFRIAPRTVSSWISQLKKAKGIVVRAAKSRYRRIWSNKQYEKWLQTNEGRQKSTSQKLRSTPQNSVSNSAKSGTSTSQNLPTIINQLEISNKSYNSAPPTPLPAGGQSPAVLADRKKEAVAGIEQPKKSFGAPKKNWQPLSEQDFQQRKQSQIEALKKKI